MRDDNNEVDPSGNTAQFRAFVTSGSGPESTGEFRRQASGNRVPTMAIAAGVAAVVVAILVVVLVTVG